MKVKKLIKLLEGVDPGSEVILSSDSEGNSYNIFSGGYQECYFKREYGGEIEIGIKELTPELEEEGYSEDDIIKGKPGIILFP